MSDNGKVKPTPASEWVKIWEQGDLVQLPGSGHIVRLRPVSLIHLLREGKIPDLLVPTAQAVLWFGLDTAEAAKVIETTLLTADLAELICKASFLEPAIVETPRNEREITIEMVEDFDKIWVMNSAVGPTLELAPFRPKQKPDVDIVPDGEGDRPTAVKTGRRK